LEDDVIGALAQRADGTLEGWCWSPSRADMRLKVDILLNDDVAAIATASRPRPGLAAEGRGDGRHGFVLNLPAAVANARRPYAISVRERSTGRIFARIVQDVPAMDDVTRNRLEGISADIEALWNEVSHLRAAQESGGTLPGSLGALSATLVARAELRRRPDHAALGVAAARAELQRSELARRGGLPRIPMIAAPRANLVLQATLQVEDTLDALHALAPAAAAAEAGIVLLGQDRTCGLPCCQAWCLGFA
jgi:hypothetical protein